jgi:hypothetical protein
MRQERILRFQRILQESFTAQSRQRGSRQRQDERRSPQQSQEVFDSLQLTVPSKQVDITKRKGGVNRILNLYQGNHELYAPVIKALMPLLNTEMSQYVEGKLNEYPDQRDSGALEL